MQQESLPRPPLQTPASSPPLVYRSFPRSSCRYHLTPPPPLFADSPCAATISNATLNGQALPPASLTYNAAGRPNVLSFGSVPIGGGKAGAAATLCFRTATRACGAFANVCGGGGECQYSVWSTSPYKCCPVSLMYNVLL